MSLTLSATTGLKLQKPESPPSLASCSPGTILTWVGFLASLLLPLLGVSSCFRAQSQQISLPQQLQVIFLKVTARAPPSSYYYPFPSWAPHCPPGTGSSQCLRPCSDHSWLTSAPLWQLLSDRLSRTATLHTSLSQPATYSHVLSSFPPETHALHRLENSWVFVVCFPWHPMTVPRMCLKLDKCRTKKLKF